MLTLRPSEIRFSQESIRNVFHEKKKHADTHIGETLDALLTGKCKISEIPPITVVYMNENWYTADNRRLWVFRKLEELGQCTKIPVGKGHRIPQKKITTLNDGTDIRVRRDPGGYHWRHWDNDQLYDDLCSDDQSSNSFDDEDYENGYTKITVAESNEIPSRKCITINDGRPGLKSHDALRSYKHRQSNSATMPGPNEQSSCFAAKGMSYPYQFQSISPLHVKPVVRTSINKPDMYPDNRITRNVSKANSSMQSETKAEYSSEQSLVNKDQDESDENCTKQDNKNQYERDVSYSYHWNTYQDDADKYAPNQENDYQGEADEYDSDHENDYQDEADEYDPDQENDYQSEAEEYQDLDTDYQDEMLERFGKCIDIPVRRVYDGLTEETLTAMKHGGRTVRVCRGDAGGHHWKTLQNPSTVGTPGPNSRSARLRSRNSDNRRSQRRRAFQEQIDEDSDLQEYTCLFPDRPLPVQSHSSRSLHIEYCDPMKITCIKYTINMLLLLVLSSGSAKYSSCFGFSDKNR
ncbi:uncharacterized protein LOC110455930 isoform X2 [Mizuhopecten yessoensis]|uniref:Uncharacterized protein n=1 Tax=Mizuhopecten yessoensis TaxID=6573 RepID=A0A210R4F5_MIZYE|nr:uncharacterized protein LOC110455930 isoform X2 [Mizuhopecten yessoensis]OWF55761.1 hypothetical protein KP79_PYT00193 [Mizuhopecten yessoensis]